MKNYLRPLLLRPTFVRPLFLRQLFRISIALVFLYLLFLFYRGVNNTTVPQRPVPQNRVVHPASPGLPVNLVIPAINVNADIQHVGVDIKGDMAVPSTSFDVGWFKLGSRPGEKGSAVISGHIDGNAGEAGVFNNLHKIEMGDTLIIYDDKGAMTTFVVREKRIYNPGYAEEVFSSNDTAHLNLVTCDGVWDSNKKSYTKRLVVFADVEK